MQFSAHHRLTSKRIGIRKWVLHTGIILTLFCYLSGSTGPLLVHAVHLLHHIVAHQDHGHLDERNHTDAHGEPRGERHTHGDLIDHAVIWSNADADEDRSAHAVQNVRLSLHVTLVAFPPPVVFDPPSPAVSIDDRQEGELRSEPPTPPPRLSPPRQFSI